MLSVNNNCTISYIFGNLKYDLMSSMAPFIIHHRNSSSSIFIIITILNS